MSKTTVSIEGADYALLKTDCGEGISIFKKMGHGFRYVTVIPNESGYQQVAHAAIIAINAIEKAKASSFSRPIHEQQLSVA